MTSFTKELYWKYYMSSLESSSGDNASPRQLREKCVIVTYTWRILRFLIICGDFFKPQDIVTCNASKWIICITFRWMPGWPLPLYEWRRCVFLTFSILVAFFIFLVQFRKKTNNLNPTQKLIFTKLAKIPPLAPTPPSAKFLTGQLWKLSAYLCTI